MPQRPTNGRELDALLLQTGLAELLTLRTSRKVHRRNNLEVWSDRL